MTPNWMEVDAQTLRAKVIGTPTKEDVEATQINAQLIVELYSR